MKKFISFTLCAAMLLASASCASETELTTVTTTETTTATTTTSEDITSATTESSTTTPVPTEAPADPDRVVFNTADRDGKTYNDSIFSDYKLTMINFWEPWCGPCVGEIPDLEKLYEAYKDKGFLILGVYSEEHMEADVDALIKKTKVSYPILKYDVNFDKFKTGYVPTTIFVDKNGHLVDLGSSNDENGQPYVIGAKSLDEWTAMVRDYLEK